MEKCEKSDINRFLFPQEMMYPIALREMGRGRKLSHWIWYIFPQLRGLGRSFNADYYGIADEEEARRYLCHPVLGARLVEITEVILALDESDPYALMGDIDGMKLHSSMTLFAYVSERGSVFERALEKYFFGERDSATIALLG